MTVSEERAGLGAADLTDRVGHVPDSLLYEVDRGLRRMLEL